MSYLIKRPMDGVSLNGGEYLLDDDGNEMIFESILQAILYISICWNRRKYEQVDTKRVE